MMLSRNAYPIGEVATTADQHRTNDEPGPDITSLAQLVARLTANNAAFWGTQPTPVWALPAPVLSSPLYVAPGTLANTLLILPTDL